MSNYNMKGRNRKEKGKPEKKKIAFMETKTCDAIIG